MENIAAGVRLLLALRGVDSAILSVDELFDRIGLFRIGHKVFVQFPDPVPNNVRDDLLLLGWTLSFDRETWEIYDPV